jgi:hypothetical protein
MVMKVKIQLDASDKSTLRVAAGISHPVGERHRGEPEDTQDVQLVRLYLHVAGRNLGGSIQRELNQSREDLANSDNREPGLVKRIGLFQRFVADQWDGVRPDGRVSVPRHEPYDFMGYANRADRRATFKPFTITLLIGYSNAWLDRNQTALSKIVDCPDALRTTLVDWGL